MEDVSGKWAVLATSGTAGRQSFFAYHAARKVVTDDKPEGGDNPPPPVAGDGDITFKKVIAGTTHGLDGAVFNIYRDGQIVGSDVTKNGGIIEVKDVTKGLWTFVEVEVPEGYALDPTPHSVYVDVTDGDKQYTVSASNSPLPSLKITKADAQTFAKVKATFLVESLTGSYSATVTVDGEKTLPDLQPGVYRITEQSVEEPYIKTGTHQDIALLAGAGTVEAAFTNYVKPGLEILKKNIATGEPIAHVTYKIEQIDGSYSTTAATDGAGRIFLANIPVGSYKVTEVNPRNMMLSIDIIPVAMDEAVSISRKQIMAVDSDITRCRQRQNQNGNYDANIPYDLEQMRSETKEFMDDLMSRDQRMMLALVTLTHLADNLEQLDQDTEALQAIGRARGCQFNILRYQQEDALNTVLPLGLKRIDATRTLTTECTAVLMPFKSQEIQDAGGIYYGVNKRRHSLQALVE